MGGESGNRTENNFCSLDKHIFFDQDFLRWSLVAFIWNDVEPGAIATQMRDLSVPRRDVEFAPSQVCSPTSPVSVEAPKASVGELMRVFRHKLRSRTFPARNEVR